MKPCEKPCPKCGGNNVRVKYYARGKRTLEPFADVGREEYFEELADFSGIGVDVTIYSAKKEFLLHTCSCGFDWTGEVYEATS